MGKGGRIAESNSNTMPSACLKQCGVATVVIGGWRIAGLTSRGDEGFVYQFPPMPLLQPARHRLVLFGFEAAGGVEHVCAGGQAGDGVRDDLPLDAHEFLESCG